MHHYSVNIFHCQIKQHTTSTVPILYGFCFFPPESLITIPSSLSLLILFSWTSGENWVNGDYWCRTQFQYWLMEVLKGISSHLSLNKIQIELFTFLYLIEFPFSPRTFHLSPVKTDNILNELNSGSDGKAPVYNEGDPGSIPGSGRSPGEENGNPLQYYCLENPMDRGAWQATVHKVAKSQTRLSNFT